MVNNVGHYMWQTALDITYGKWRWALHMVNSVGHYNIIVYTAFVATNYHFYIINNIRISKNVQPCPLPPTYTYTHCKQRHRLLSTQNVSTPQHSHSPHITSISATVHISYCSHCTVQLTVNILHSSMLTSSRLWRYIAGICSSVVTCMYSFKLRYMLILLYINYCGFKM
jgi:hypothetical protein